MNRTQKFWLTAVNSMRFNTWQSSTPMQAQCWNFTVKSVVKDPATRCGKTWLWQAIEKGGRLFYGLHFSHLVMTCSCTRVTVSRACIVRALSPLPLIVLLPQMVIFNSDPEIFLGTNNSSVMPALRCSLCTITAPFLGYNNE
jgi:hypothetical protein